MRLLFIAVLGGLCAGALFGAVLFFGLSGLQSALPFGVGATPTPVPGPTLPPQYFASPIPVKTCVLPTGFACNEFEILSNGYVYLDIGQANGRGLNITGFGCNSTGTSVLVWNRTDTGLSPLWLDNGRHGVLLNGSGVGGKNYAFSECCPPESGAECRARIAFTYLMNGSQLNRTAYGDIGGPVP